jgi:hypothetical protein
MRSASSPLTGSHSSRWYLALAMPHSSGQTMAAWSPAATPSRVWPSTIFAPFAAMGMSASSPATSPAPTAGPCMALTMGLSQLMRL